MVQYGSGGVKKTTSWLKLLPYFLFIFLKCGHTTVKNGSKSNDESAHNLNDGVYSTNTYQIHGAEEKQLDKKINMEPENGFISDEEKSTQDMNISFLIFKDIEQVDRNVMDNSPLEETKDALDKGDNAETGESKYADINLRHAKHKKTYTTKIEMMENCSFESNVQVEDNESSSYKNVFDDSNSTIIILNATSNISMNGQTNVTNDKETGSLNYFYRPNRKCHKRLLKELEMNSNKKHKYKSLQRIYLNNIYAGETINLLQQVLAVDKIETYGINLYDIIDKDCGGIKKCVPKIIDWFDNNTITVGFLGAYGSSKTVLGALPLAVAAVNWDVTVLPGRSLRFLAADIGGATDSCRLRVMTQMRDLGVSAFFGPDGSCHTEAKLAGAWNLPIISHKCAGSPGLPSEQGLGTTFARTLPPAYKVSKSVVALLKAFKWTKFALIVGDVPTSAQQQMDAIKELAQNKRMEVTVEKRFSDYIPQHIADMEEIVEDTYEKTRVYVFLGEHIALVDFVRVLQRRNLLADGKYAVVAVDDEIYNPASARITHTASLEPLFNSTEDLFAFRAVLKLTPSYPTNPHYRQLWEMIKSLSAAPPFCVPNYHHMYKNVPVAIEAAHLYDAVLLWARAVTAASKAGVSASDGAAIMHLLRPTTYRSVQGFDARGYRVGVGQACCYAIAHRSKKTHASNQLAVLKPLAYFYQHRSGASLIVGEKIYMDKAGDAEGNFTVIGLVKNETTPGGWSAQPVAAFRYTSNDQDLPDLVGASQISWIGGQAPAAEPACGFDGAACSLNQDPRLVAAAVAATAAAVLGAALLFRHYRYEQKLASVLWKIDAKELTFIPILMSTHSTGTAIDVEPRRAHTTIAFYRGNIVAVKRLHKKSIDVTRVIRKELIQIRELRHENLNGFVGACVETGKSCIVTAYCTRGSLARVLADSDLHLDDMFVASLVADLLRGLTYIHETPLVSHGNLTSSNCLVDSRWVLKISDYGLHSLKSGCAEAEGVLRMEKRALWRAPELLRDPNPPARGTQKGDIYSFGIVLYEILGRNGPWGETNLTNSEIIGRVRQPIGGVLFRPPLGQLTARASVLAVLQACWLENPERRPDLRLIRIRLKDMHAGMKTNIFDNMLTMMEKYASDLETLVAARTEELTQEKRRTDNLLNQMLPRSVAEALKRGERVSPESFDCVTIYFSDIVGFTKMAAAGTPMQVVNILNELYTCCDEIISLYNVYKVETIGDSYMVVGGLPDRSSRHAAEVASLALHVLDSVSKIRLRNLPNSRLMIRIGMHSGQCAAGVVGSKMPRYCLFGDTVNVANRMESNGEPQKIHISHDTHLLLKASGGYHMRERGFVNVKGKGEMKTWWLIGEDHERRIKKGIRGVCRDYPTEADLEPEWEEGRRSDLGVRERARLSCGFPTGPGSSLSSPGPPTCACFEAAPRQNRSAPAVTFRDC